MPSSLHLVQSSGKRKAKTFANISIASQMNVPCSLVITLEAVLLDYDRKTKRSYEWIQLSGTTVEWLMPRTDLVTAFIQTTPPTEKVFRLYVDRGTIFEQYFDILVTPIFSDTVNLSDSYCKTEQTTEKIYINWKPPPIDLNAFR